MKIIMQNKHFFRLYGLIKHSVGIIKSITIIIIILIAPLVILAIFFLIATYFINFGFFTETQRVQNHDGTDTVSITSDCGATCGISYFECKTPRGIKILSSYNVERYCKNIDEPLD
jgi:hypothetical protein